MKLTDEQLETLRLAYMNNTTADYSDVKAYAAAYHSMIQASKTHRVVEAPEGFQFHNNSNPNVVICDYINDIKNVRFNFWAKPTPKPCPPPQLDPVTVTVESVYGDTLPKALELAKGKVALFGKASELRQQGFTHGITFQIPRVIDIGDFTSYAYCICFKDMEPA
jgi:hypothetical protein